MKSAEATSPAAEVPAAKVVPLPRRARLRRDELEFLPAALEIVETPASPLGRIVAWTLMAFFAIALTWACLGHIDIIATAQGKIVPVGRVKVIQLIETGMVTAIRVQDGDRVSEGQVLVELDHTVSTAERNRVRYDLQRARLDVARLKALRAGFNSGFLPIGFAPSADVPAYEVERTRSAMLAQANQQISKIAALDQQIDQKIAEAEAIAALIEKLKTGLPILQEVAEA